MAGLIAKLARIDPEFIHLPGVRLVEYAFLVPGSLANEWMDTPWITDPYTYHFIVALDYKPTPSSYKETFLLGLASEGDW